MVREIPCNAWALGFSGTHHIKHVVGGPLTGQDLKTEWTEGFHRTCKYFKGSEGLAHSSLLWRVSPRACEPFKELFTLPFYFLFFCVFGPIPFSFQPLLFQSSIPVFPPDLSFLLFFHPRESWGVRRQGQGFPLDMPEQCKLCPIKPQMLWEEGDV